MRPPLIAIHDSDGGFHQRWVAYCERIAVPFRRVNCYRSGIVAAVDDCDALMWHHSQSDGRAKLMARPLLTALEAAGKVVFPDFHTAWHFDDKLSQKYLFEALRIPTPRTEVFVDRTEALDWAATASYPQVFKLRGGAGSANVRLVSNEGHARRLVLKAFARGFPAYDGFRSLVERVRRLRRGEVGPIEPLKGVARLFSPPPYARILGRDRGYAVFQEFLPNNDHDLRIVVIGDRAFGLKRLVRKGDFRASGSGRFVYARESFPEQVVALAFLATQRLRAQCAALDFAYNIAGEPQVLEVSYGFGSEAYDPCPGYWDRSLKWHEESFSPQEWMVDQVIEEVQRRQIESVTSHRNEGK